MKEIWTSDFDRKVRNVFETNFKQFDFAKEWYDEINGLLILLRIFRPANRKNQSHISKVAFRQAIEKLIRFENVYIFSLYIFRIRVFLIKFHLNFFFR